MKRRYLFLLILGWLLIVIASFFWNYRIILSNNDDIVLHKSRAFFDQILITRAWNALHNGVYVPISETTLPNPYLKDSLKNVVTTDSLKLTKINPAYMTRQISEIDNNIHNLQFHITSLSPLNPQNIANPWEQKALKKFEKGSSELLELLQTPQGEMYKYMAPLKTEKSCLNCHAEQGYKLGDIRGGISISFPAQIYSNATAKQLLSISIIHIIVLILGTLGLYLYLKTSNKFFSIVNEKNRELQSINNTKDKFFSIIAHDLKSPITTILGYLNFLRDEYKTMEENERIEFINATNKSAQSSLKLLNNLLMWAQSQQSRITLDFKNHFLNQIIDDSLEAYLPTAKSKNLNVSISIPNSLKIHIDYQSMKTVFANLFSNAIKFTPRNGNIEITAKEENNLAKIQFTDSGIGISEDNIKKLFQLDKFIHTEGTEHEEGSGLGLILCKEFTEKNKGQIFVESTPQKGTRITLTIPLARE